MGTRHLICAVLDGEYKIAQYGQWDGYPSGQGKTVLDFLRKCNPIKFAKQLREKVGPVDWTEYHKRMRELGGDPDSEWMTMDVADALGQEFPHLTRDTGAGILDIVYKTKEPLGLKNARSFAGDSLFCEYAYVIDLDKNTLEVYRGFNKEPLAEGERFADTVKEEDDYHQKAKDNYYYPIRFWKSWPIYNLPSYKEFLAELTEKDEDE